MSDITVAKLQDVLNDIERNAYEGILGSEEVTRAYVLAGELGEIIEKLEAENAKLREQGARLFDKTLELGTENAKLRELAQYIYDEGYGDDWFAEQAAELGIEPNY